jgi:hypothetical protein
MEVIKCAMRGIFAAGASVVETHRGGDIYGIRVDYYLVAWKDARLVHSVLCARRTVKP